MTARQTQEPLLKVNARQETMAADTRKQYDELLLAIHDLEVALAAAAPGREHAWSRQAATKLKGVADALAQHIAATEELDGLFAEIDDTWPTMAHRVERLRQAHSSLVEQARTLTKQLEHYGEDGAPNFQDIRRQTALLLTELRHHRAAESDLIYEGFFVDLGVGP